MRDKFTALSLAKRSAIISLKKYTKKQEPITPLPNFQCFNLNNVLLTNQELAIHFISLMLTLEHFDAQLNMLHFLTNCSLFTRKVRIP